MFPEVLGRICQSTIFHESMKEEFIKTVWIIQTFHLFLLHKSSGKYQSKKNKI